MATKLKEVDVVTCIDLLHHIPPEARHMFLQELLSNMKTGQQLIIKDLDPLPRWKAVANNITDYISTRSIVHYIGLSPLSAVLEANNFHVGVKKRLDKHVWNHYVVVAHKC